MPTLSFIVLAVAGAATAAAPPEAGFRVEAEVAIGDLRGRSRSGSVVISVRGDRMRADVAVGDHRSTIIYRKDRDAREDALLILDPARKSYVAMSRQGALEAKTNLDAARYLMVKKTTKVSEERRAQLQAAVEARAMESDRAVLEMRRQGDSERVGSWQATPYLVEASPAGSANRQFAWFVRADTLGLSVLHRDPPKAHATTGSHRVATGGLFFLSALDAQSVAAQVTGWPHDPGDPGSDHPRPWPHPPGASR